MAREPALPGGPRLRMRRIRATTVRTFIMKPYKSEISNGEAAFERFREALKTVLTVCKSDLPPRPHLNEEKSTQVESYVP